jgi:ribosomal protein L6P/L9E
MELYIKNKNLVQIKNNVKYNLIDLTQGGYQKFRSFEKLEINSFKKKIYLNGLGYKCQILENKLSFKLNLSHNLEIDIPKYITKVSQKKNVILFEAKDKVMLGNFLDLIYRLRPSDIYKNKGFSLDSKLKILKEVNKKNKKG